MTVRFEDSQLSSGNWFNPLPETVRTFRTRSTGSYTRNVGTQDSRASVDRYAWDWAVQDWIPIQQHQDAAGFEHDMWVDPPKQKFLKIPKGREGDFPYYEIVKAKTLLTLKQISKQWMDDYGTGVSVCAGCGVNPGPELRLMDHDSFCPIYQRVMEIIEVGAYD